MRSVSAIAVEVTPGRPRARSPSHDEFRVAQAGAGRHADAGNRSQLAPTLRNRQTPRHFPASTKTAFCRAS
jgi:hypothetical protein